MVGGGRGAARGLGNGVMLVGPLELKVLSQRPACLPPGSWVRAQGLPPLGSLWFSCPSGLLRLFPTSLSGSIYGDSPAC